MMQLRALLMLATLIFFGVPAANAANPPVQTACMQAAGDAEALLRLPRHLLKAVSLAETGRWNAARKASFAWPWTVTVDGKGRFFRTKAAATAFVQEMLRRGVTNIDVGCMQINLRYHPRAFRTLDEAFDPRRNALYAGALMIHLRKTHRSWPTTVAHYHTARPGAGKAYWQKVQKLWKTVRRGNWETQKDLRVSTFRQNRKSKTKATRRQAPVNAPPRQARK